LFVHQLETWDGRAAADFDENAIQIARDYLERTRELGEPEVASRVLLDTVELMVRRGELRRLFLSNKAIDAYKRFKNERRVLILPCGLGWLSRLQSACRDRAGEAG
jgi:hypothetical protein